jgi:uncharacterized protein YfaT (DUF1175 family)
MRYLLFIFLFGALIGCQENESKDKKPIAKIHDEYLYLSDISKVIPENKTGQDSVLIAQNYIKNWIKKQLLLTKAEQNLPKESKDIQKQIDEYRTSLLIYKYQQQWIDQKLDTIVHHGDVEEYYNQNKSNFMLDENLVKVLFIKLPNNSPNIENVKQWYKSDDEESFSRLEDYCYQYAEKFDDFNNNWVTFKSLINKVDYEVENTERFLKYNTYIEQKDSVNQYFIRINEYKLKGTPAPLSYVQDKIETLILNKRKHQLLERLENDIYNEALNHNEFVIY